MEIVAGSGERFVSDSDKNNSVVDEEEVARINAIYDKIPAEEQLAFARFSMRTMWVSVKNDTW